MKKPRAPRLVTVLIFTTITIVFWVFFTVYQILTGSHNIDVPEELLKPINPTLDKEVLDTLPNKIFIEEGEEINPLMNTQVDTSQLNETFPTPLPTTTPEEELLPQETNSPENISP